LIELLDEQIGSARVDLGIDAFDECKCQTQLLKRMHQLKENHDTRIFMTTRPNLIHLIQDGELRIDAGLESANDDIRRFVVEQVSDPKEDLLRYLPDLVTQGIRIHGEEFQRQLVETVVKKSGRRCV
jgi:hypothetical protein